MKFKILLVFLVMFTTKSAISANENLNLYDFSFEDIDGNQVNLEKFTGKPILIVNTASRCGYTPQYSNLQNLFLEYKDSDLTIIATTSNSFYQEYEEVEDIKKICLVNYGVGFVTSSPMNVKGNDAHPIYSWIEKEYNKKLQSIADQERSLTKKEISLDQKIEAKERDLEHIKRREEE